MISQIGWTVVPSNDGEHEKAQGVELGILESSFFTEICVAIRRSTEFRIELAIW